MANDSQDMRRVLDLLETREETLLEGWVDNLKNKIHRNLGDKERKELAKNLKQQWTTWLGQTDRQGTLDDMDRFMTHRIGFDDEDIDFVMHKAEISPEASNDSADEKKPAPSPKTPSSTADKEDGRPIPKDLNTKLSDYGKVGQPAKESIDLEEKVAVGDGDVLSSNVVDAIMNFSAARINDQYLYNGPENDQADAIAQATKMGLAGKAKTFGSSRDPDLGPNEGGKKPSGQYDTKEMMRALDAMGIKPQTVSAMLRKASMTNKPSEFTDKEKKTLAMIGFALLRSRT